MNDPITRLRKNLKQQNKLIAELKKLFTDYENIMRKAAEESKKGYYER